MGLVNWIGNTVGGAGGGGAAAPLTPSVVSVTVEDANPNDWVVTFNRTVTTTSAGWTPKIDAVSATISGTAGTGTSIITFTTTETVANGEVLTIDYVESSGNCVSVADSSPLADITGLGVTNNVAVVSNEPVASSVSVGEVTGVYTLSYTYSSPIATDEAVPETWWEAITVTGTVSEGNVLTATVLPSGTYTYQWYSASNVQGDGDAALSGETASTYTVGAGLDSKFIRVEATDVHGDAYSSYYTDAVAPSFPFTLAWESLYKPSEAVNIATNEYWGNLGTLGNATIDGAASTLPTYGSGVVNFDSASLQRLVKPSTSPRTGLWELWIEIAPSAVPSVVQKIIAYTSSVFLEMQADGSLFWGATDLGFTLANGVTYRIRIKMNGASSTIEIRSDTNTVLKAETAVSLTTDYTAANGRLGSISNGGNRYWEGSIKHVLTGGLTLSAQDVTDMWAWLDTQ